MRLVKLVMFRCGDRVEIARNCPGYNTSCLKGMRGTVVEVNHANELVWWQVTVRFGGELVLVDVDHLRHVSLPEQIGELG